MTNEISILTIELKKKKDMYKTYYSVQKLKCFLIFQHEITVKI